MRNLIIELTNHCNLSCSMCPRHTTNMKLGYMEDWIFFDLLHQVSARDETLTLIPFWRGEPTLHPEFADWMRVAVELIPRVIIATNGIRQDVWPDEVFFKLTEISVSIHSEQSLATLDMLLAKRGGFSKPRIQASTVMGYDVPVERIKQLQPDIIRTYAPHTINGIYGQTLPAHRPESPRKFCSKLKHDLVISWDGQVSRCCHVWQPEPNLNVRTSSLDEVERRLRSSKICSEYPDSTCAKCDQWTGFSRGERLE